MKITTQDRFDEYEVVQSVGLVKGNTIRARHVGKDILAGLRTLVGGEVTEYTKMLAEAREQAMDRMIEDAKSLGANGIVCMRFTTAPVMQGAAELLAYGTGVKLRKKNRPQKPAPSGES
ncbi:YbjQ family protein [Thermodesulfobacteriota bacterium]